MTIDVSRYTRTLSELQPYTPFNLVARPNVVQKGSPTTADLDGAPGFLSFKPANLPGPILRPWNVSIAESVDSDDVIVTGNTQDKVFVGAGDDLVGADGKDDTIVGGSGNDALFGGLGDDLIIGGSGNDVISGYDTIGIGFTPTGNSDSGLAQQDQIFGDYDTGFSNLHRAANEAGTASPTFNDFIVTGKGSQLINAGPGDDYIYSGPRGFRDNLDYIYPGPGADAIMLNYEDVSNQAQQTATNWWQTYAENFAKEFGKNYIKEKISNFTKKLAADALESLGAKFLLSFVSSALPLGVGEALKAAVQFIEDIVEASLPKSDDLIVVFDFDPREDVLLLPVGDDLSFDYGLGDPAQSDFLSSDVKNQYRIEINHGDGEAKIPYAQIFVSNHYLEDIGLKKPGTGITISDVDNYLQRIVDDFTLRTDVPNNLSASDVSLENQTNELEPGASSPFADATLDAPLRIIGAIAPLSAIGTQEVSLYAGTNMGDIITVNNGFVLPENFFNSRELVFSRSTTVYGFDGDDILYGGSFADAIYGGNGNDDLYGFLTANETEEVLDGGAGDDRIFTQDSVAHVVGGNGTGDILSFEHAKHNAVKVHVDADIEVSDQRTQTAGFNVPHDKESSFKADVGAYRIDGIEEITGTSFNDEFIGGSRTRGRIDSEPISMKVNGGDGNDVYGPGKVPLLVQDFDPLHDYLDFSSLGLNSLDQVSTAKLLSGNSAPWEIYAADGTSDEVSIIIQAPPFTSRSEILDRVILDRDTITHETGVGITSSTETDSVPVASDGQTVSDPKPVNANYLSPSEDSLLAIVFESTDAAHQNSLGWFKIGHHGDILDPTLLFEDATKVEPGRQFELDSVLPGQKIGLFNIVDGGDRQDLDGKLSFIDPSTGQNADIYDVTPPELRIERKNGHTEVLDVEVFFSSDHDPDDGLNTLHPGQSEQVTSGYDDNGKYIIGFEDINRHSGKSDHDFNDLVVSVEFI